MSNDTDEKLTKATVEHNAAYADFLRIEPFTASSRLAWLAYEFAYAAMVTADVAHRARLGVC
jgi:hypothetical protein